MVIKITVVNEDYLLTKSTTETYGLSPKADCQGHISNTNVLLGN